jgi:tryptophan synthase alpha chain
MVVLNLSGRGDKDIFTVADAPGRRFDQGPHRARFAALKAEGRAAFVAYVMAGDPDPATSLSCSRACRRRRRHHRAGLPLLRSRWPRARPSSGRQRALAAGMTLRGVLDMAAEFRKADPTRRSS